MSRRYGNERGSSRCVAARRPLAYRRTVAGPCGQVPVGSLAAVCVPATSVDSVPESGHPVGNANGVTVIGMQGSCLQLHVGSGTYNFNSTLP